MGLIDAYSMIFNGKFVSHDMPYFFMAASKVAKHLRTMFQYVISPRQSVPHQWHNDHGLILGCASKLKANMGRVLECFSVPFSLVFTL